MLARQLPPRWAAAARDWMNIDEHGRAEPAALPDVPRGLAAGLFCGGDTVLIEAARGDHAQRPAVVGAPAAGVNDVGRQGIWQQDQ